MRNSTNWHRVAQMLGKTLAASMTLLVLFSASALAADQETNEPTWSLPDLLECRQPSALTTPLDDVATQATSAGFSCRTLHTSTGNSLDCTGERRVNAFSAPVRQFTLTQRGDGGASIAIAINAPTTRIQSALTSRPDAADPIQITVEQREDNAAELRCRLPATSAPNASISGRLSFRGVEPIPAMRVCAAAADDPDRPTCVNSSEGNPNYRITGLPAGRFYLTAFPLSQNPNRLFVVHASGRAGCGNGQADCGVSQLQPVGLTAGQQRDGVHLETLLPNLPRSLRRRSD